MTETSTITLSFTFKAPDNEDLDDIAEAIAEFAQGRFPALAQVEHHERDMPRTYGMLFIAKGFDPDADDDEDDE